MKYFSTQFYDLTSGEALFNKNLHNTIVYFDIFIRKAPDGAAFAISNGIGEIIDFIKNMHFDENEIQYLSSLKIFSTKYLQFLKNLRFTGDIWAVPDGTVFFANEPVLTVRAPYIQACLIETAVLQKFNHAILITTKASRMVRAAKKIPIIETGAKRASGEEPGVMGSLYAYEAGILGTTSTETGRKFNVRLLGSMSHSYIQNFESEYDAFKTYAKTYPDDCILLIDTYNTLESGLENAIKTYEKVLKPMGKTLKGIRIDNGDLAFLAKKCRQRLNESGLKSTEIILSNGIDEFVIESLLAQKTPVDMLSIGEKLVTATSDPIFRGCYKMVAIEENGKIIPKIKISDNYDSINCPHFKNIFRIYDSDGKIITDHICLFSEKKPTKTLLIKDQDRPWLVKEITNFSAREIRFKFVSNGKQILKTLSPNEVRKNISRELATLPEEALRISHPQIIRLNISDELTKIKDELIHKRYR